MAVATDAMICTINLMVSFLLMVDQVIRLILFFALSSRASPLRCHLERSPFLSSRALPLFVISTKRSAWRDLYGIRGDLSTTLEMTVDVRRRGGALCPKPLWLNRRSRRHPRRHLRRNYHLRNYRLRYCFRNCRSGLNQIPNQRSNHLRSPSSRHPASLH